MNTTLIYILINLFVFSLITAYCLYKQKKKRRINIGVIVMLLGITFGSHILFFESSYKKSVYAAGALGLVAVGCLANLADHLKRGRNRSNR